VIGWKPGRGCLSKRPFFERFKRWETLVFLVYAGITIFFTYPAITLVSRTYAEPRDPLGSLWHYWWVKYAVAHHLSTSVMTLVNVPFYLNLGRYSVDPLTAYTLRGMTVVFDETIVYNVFLLASFLLAAVCMYYLVKYLTRSPAAAAFSGLAFAFCPFMLTQGKEHISLVVTFWIPLFVLTLIKGWRRRTYGSILWCVLVFLLLTLFNFQFGLFCGVFAVTFLVTLWMAGRPWRGLKRSPRNLLPKILLLAGSAAIVAGVLLFAARSLFHFKNLVTSLYMYSARPWDYFVPHADGFLFGNLTRGFIFSHLHGGFTAESSLFLGYVPLALSVVGIVGALWKRGPTGKSGEAPPASEAVNEIEEPVPAGLSPTGEARRYGGDEKPRADETRRFVWGLIFSGIIAFMFSMPPTSKVLGIKLYMPSYFLFKVVPQFRAYARFGIILMMCVTVLAGYGIAFLTERGRLRKHGALFVAILMAVVLLEFSIVPPFYSLDTKKTTDYYRWLKERPGQPVAVVYPVFEGNDFENYNYLFQQRLHRKKLINGSTLDDPSDVYRWGVLDITDPSTPGLLKDRGTEYALVIPSLYSRPAIRRNYTFPTTLDESRIAAGLTLIRRFSDCLVYRVNAPPADFVPLFVEGSYPPYSNPEGKFWYPGVNNVTVGIESRLHQPAVCDIKLKVMSARSRSKVTFMVNKQLKATVEANVWPVDVIIRDVTLTPGHNTLEIKSDGMSTRLTEIPLYEDVVATMMLSNILVEEKQ